MSEYFYGFETGLVGHDMAGNPNGPAVSISTNHPRTGNFCGQVALSGGNYGYWIPGFRSPTDGGTATQYGLNAPCACSFAFRIDVAPTTGSEEVAGTQQGGIIRVNPARQLELWSGGASPSIVATGTTVLTVGQWYIIEWYMNASIGTQWRVWPSGGTPGAVEFTWVSAAGSTVLTFGTPTNRNSQTMTVSYDDIWFKDVGVTGFIGESRTYLVPGNPNSPIWDMWSKTPNTAINVVWNDTPSNTSTYATTSSASFAKQSMAHNPLWPAGSTVTINAVKTTLLCQYGGSLVLNDMRLVGPTGSIVETDTPLGNLFFTPWWSTPWSPVPSLADLNSAQIGVYMPAGLSGSCTVTECYLQVCYSNLVLAPSGIGLGPAGAPIEFVIM